MLCRASEAAKAPSALPMIHFMYFIVDSVQTMPGAFSGGL